MPANRSHKAHLVEDHGSRLMDRLPVDGSAVLIGALADSLGLTVQAVGRLAGKLKQSVVRTDSKGRVWLARVPALCEVTYGPR